MSIIDLEIHLPWPPSVNNYYVHTRNGAYISKKGEVYREIVNEYINEQTGQKLKIKKQIMVTCVLYPPDRRTRDIDNYNKSLLDAVSHSKLWSDDSLIDQMFIFRGEIIKQGKVVLFVENAGIIIPTSSPHIAKKF